MDTAALQFNIIYTPNTVRYLTPFVATLLRWSDCRYRLVSNGCGPDELNLLTNLAASDERLELLVMPERHMISHGETLDYLFAREQSEYFCFMDSDVMATGPFLEEFGNDIHGAAYFSSCLPLWHNPEDITIPSWFRHMHGIHAYTDQGQTLGCAYFSVYKRDKLAAAMEASGATMQLTRWESLSPAAQGAMERTGQCKDDYDTGKALTMVLIDQGEVVKFRQSSSLKHIGGFTQVGAIKGALLYSRGILDNLAAALPGNRFIRVADIWYAWRLGNKNNSWAENKVLAGRIRRRTATARYFYLLLVGLMDKKPLPAVPRLGDKHAEAEIALAGDEITALIQAAQ